MQKKGSFLCGRLGKDFWRTYSARRFVCINQNSGYIIFHENHLFIFQLNCLRVFLGYLPSSSYPFSKFFWFLKRILLKSYFRFSLINPSQFHQLIQKLNDSLIFQFERIFSLPIFILARFQYFLLSLNNLFHFNLCLP